jgi:PAS domain S-box-containing protein
LLGYSEEEVLGQGWWYIRSEDQEVNFQIRDRILKGLVEDESYVTPIRTKGGRIRWIQWVDTSLDSGVKVGVGLDITDRHDIEERYRLMIESATDIIYTANYKGHFTFVNEVAEKITGYTQEEMLGRHFTSLVSPDWKEDTANFYKKQFLRRVVSTYYEFPMRSKSGEIIWIGQTVRILFDSEDSEKIIGFQAIARDITEKKEYEEELEKLSLVASETSNGVMISDSEGKIDWVNEAVTRMTGYGLSELYASGDQCAYSLLKW